MRGTKNKINALALLAENPLVASTIKSNAHNNKLITSLCYMSSKAPKEVIEICQELPYSLAGIQAYYRRYGEFPE